MEQSQNTLPAWLNTDPRHEERAEANMPGFLVVRDQDARSVTIANLSSLGCRIEADFKLLVGTFVTLQLPAHASVCGWVAWSKSGSFGIDFHEPLAAATLAAVAGHAEQVSYGVA